MLVQQCCINRSVMGAPWHQTTLELGFRQNALESSLLAIVVMWILWREQLVLAGRQPTTWCFVTLHAFRSELCSLPIVMGNLLSGTVSKPVFSSKRARLPGERLQGSTFLWKSEEEVKQFQKSLSPG